MQKKSSFRIFVFLLALILVVGSLPGTVLAVTEDPPETVTVDGEEYVLQTFEWESEETIYAVNEIVSLREENVKHFSLPNGTYRAVAYDSAVHRLDENGKWQDIDNSLLAATEGGKEVLRTADGRVTVPAAFSAGESVLSLWEDGIGIEMYPVSQLGSLDTAPMTATSLATVQNAPKRPLGFDTVEEAIAVDNKASVTYADVFPGADLQYELRGNDVKENIIIGAPSALYEYTFLLRLSALTATLEEDGSISLQEETGRERAVIPAPFMYDAAGNRSYLVSYTLEDGGDGLYALTVSADADWINDEERTFPVTVDPYIDWSEDGAYAVDTYISSTNPDENFGLEEDVKVSANDVAYVLVELPNVPSGCIVNSANLAMNYYATSSQGATSGSTSISAYQVLRYWDEWSVTWNTAAGWTDFGIATEALSTVSLSTASNTTSANRATADIPITDAAKAWYNQSNNYGVALKFNSGNMDTLYFTAFDGGEGYAYISVEYLYYIPDGIYALNNVQAGWMTVSGSTVKQQSLTTAPNANFNRSGLFKITRVTSDAITAARYVIRCMSNNALGLGVSGSSVITKSLPTRDSDVDSDDTFYIELHEDGFRLRSCGSGTVIAATEANSSALTTLPQSTDSDLARWNFVAYTGAQHRAGFDVAFPYTWILQGAVVGNTYSIPYPSYWSTYIGADTPRIRVAPGCDAIALYTWNEDPYSSTVTPISPGTMEIYAEILNGTTGAVVECGSSFCSVIPAQGVYYFQNSGTGRYMDVEGSSTASGAAIHEWDLHTATQEKWIVEHVAGSGGYIRLKSAYSNLYLGISNTNSAYVGQYSNLNNYTLWRFERTAAGNLMLICKATEIADLVLSVPSSANGNGTNLTQDSQDEDLAFNEWKMYPFVSKLRLTLYADGGYRQRYNDESGAGNYSDRIDMMMKKVQQRYLEEFGILIAYSDVNSYTSWADLCPSTGNNPDALCECLGTCVNSDATHIHDLHHKNYYNIWGRIAPRDKTIDLGIYFLGHNTCRIGNDGHTDKTFGGMTDLIEGYAMITHLWDDLPTETRTLMHEIGHFYQVKHHNGADDNPTTEQIKIIENNPNYHDMCIYGAPDKWVEANGGDEIAGRETLNYVRDHLLLCDGCKDQISQHITDYNHS